ncbi:GNAT family N-acetyltransferase [Rhizobium tumorigenes]|uniref:GNAT family N-acetyltransferase n=1 Tax=Rhizobium tumorigenes TaxID=2041385 RepID=UPI00241EE636|nr:GNAT family N-acetyltransferase [Rhizobium tumorigenes]WFR99573.1 GNAT family N-acetyltransferase [Rhizobium tumorigenes]
MSVRQAVEIDVDFIVKAYASAFAFTRSRTVQYIEDIGLSSFHMIEQGSEPAAAFALIDTGHWFGGNVIPACNIAHVAISPEHRGSGLAASILDFAGEEALRRGADVVSLFASTRPVYRKSGFELAGSEMIYEAETSELYKVKASFKCRRVSGESIRPTIGLIYEEHCRDQYGALKRHPGHWNVLLRAADEELSTFVFEADGRDLGYIVLDTGNPEYLLLRDWVALTGQTAREILKFLGTFSTVYPRVRWHGGPADQLIFALPDKGWRLVHQEEFLMRVMSPEKALAARGYGHVSASIRIQIVGAPEKQTLLLTVKDGKAACQKDLAGEVDITIGLAQFATLFTGFRSAYFLHKAGWILGDAEAIRRCNDIFSGPAPWVGEHF